MEQEDPYPERPADGEVRYGSLIEYDSDDPEFVRGAEVGATEEKLILLRDEVVRQPMQRTNEEMVGRLAHAFGRSYEIEVIDDEWMLVTFELPTMPNVMDALFPSPEDDS